MDFDLTPEQEQMRDATRRMVERDIDPVLAANDPDTPLSKAEFLKVLGAVAAHGMTAARIPESAGGTGISLLDFGIMAEQVSPVMMVPMVTQDACITRLHAEAAPELCERLLPDLIAGRKIGSTAATEPAAGSDPRGVQTRLTRDGDTVVINGRKHFITSVSIADVCIVTCTEGVDEEGRGRLVKVVVEPEVSPFETREIDGMGLRQGHWGEVVFEDCRVPAVNVLDDSSSSVRSLHDVWIGNRAVIGLIAVHMAQKALDATLEFTGLHTQFGKPIGGHQLIQRNLSDMATAITTSRLLCYYALSRADKGEPAAGVTAMAKRYAVDACEQVIRLAMDCHGGMGVSREAGLEGLLRDVRMLTPPDGTNEILTLIHGRDLTGLAAFR
jgi:alkylation response protein AidB-like acyl-CoA dehydrogenase